MAACSKRADSVTTAEKKISEAAATIMFANAGLGALFSCQKAQLLATALMRRIGGALGPKLRLHLMH